MQVIIHLSLPSHNAMPSSSALRRFFDLHFNLFLYGLLLPCGDHSAVHPRHRDTSPWKAKEPWQSPTWKTPKSSRLKWLKTFKFHQPNSMTSLKAFCFFIWSVRSCFRSFNLCSFFLSRPRLSKSDTRNLDWSDDLSLNWSYLFLMDVGTFKHFGAN